MNDEHKNELIVSELPGLVAPVTTLVDSIKIFKEYEKAKTELLSESDILWIGNDGRPTTKDKGKPHIKRSGWRKLARFFGLSLEIKGKNKQLLQDGNYMWIYNIRVSHPSGAFADSEGVCSSNDAFFTKGGRKTADEEKVMLKAQTVGFNRAISDLLGGGEVSAEEIEIIEPDETPIKKEPKPVPPFKDDDTKPLLIAALSPDTISKYKDTQFKMKYKGYDNNQLAIWTILNTSDESKKMHDVHITETADMGFCDCDGWKFNGTCIHLIVVRDYLSDGEFKNNVLLIE